MQKEKLKMQKRERIPLQYFIREVKVQNNGHKQQWWIGKRPLSRENNVFNLSKKLRCFVHYLIDGMEMHQTYYRSKLYVMGRDNRQKYSEANK